MSEDDEKPPEVNVREETDWVKLFKESPDKAAAKYMEFMEKALSGKTGPIFGCQYDMSFSTGDTLHIHFNAPSLQHIVMMTAEIQKLFMAWPRFRPFPEVPPHQSQEGSGGSGGSRP